MVHSLSNKLPSKEFACNFKFLELVAQLWNRFYAYYPFLAASKENLGVFIVRIYPNVRDTKYCFRAKCCGRQKNLRIFLFYFRIVLLKEDERVFFRCDSFALQSVMIASRTLISWAPNHGVCPLSYIAAFSEL